MNLVFHWLFHPMRGGWGDCIDRRPLEEGAADWKKYLSVNLSPGDHYGLMEFVRDDSEDRFKQDAAVLRRLLD